MVQVKKLDGRERNVLQMWGRAAGRGERSRCKKPWTEIAAKAQGMLGGTTTEGEVKELLISVETALGCLAFGQASSWAGQQSCEPYQLLLL